MASTTKLAARGWGNRTAQGPGHGLGVMGEVTPEAAQDSAPSGCPCAGGSGGGAAGSARGVGMKSVGMRSVGMRSVGMSGEDGEHRDER